MKSGLLKMENFKSFSLSVSKVSLASSLYVQATSFFNNA
jgi:hypothetical protein